jgi:histidine triad (HIT) family protein
MSECIFCRIASKEAPAQIVYEDERAMAFLDINPVSRGHTLVIPKRHYRDLLEIPSEELQAVIAVAQRVARAIQEGLSAAGINLLQSNGALAGQVIPHFHLHLIPRYRDDGLRLGHRGDYREADFDGVCERVRRRLYHD